eukprot:4246978-Alexandrium_andersonii.AAC.1
MATRGRAGERRRRPATPQAPLIDVHKAHFHTFAQEHVYAVLPSDVATPGMCAELNRRLYGARAAPA